MAAKSGKAGRNGDFCKAYAASGKADQAQFRRLLRDLKRRRKFEARRTHVVTSDAGVTVVMNRSELNRAIRRIAAGKRVQPIMAMTPYSVRATGKTSDKNWQAAYERSNARIPNGIINRIIAEQNVRAFV